LPRDAVAAALNRQPDATSAIARRRQLRDLVNGAVERNRGDQGTDGEGPVPTNIPSSREAEAAERLRRLTNERRGQSLSR
jgi:hypothetical protein